MGFNKEHYNNYLEVTFDQGGKGAGYCFATNQWLGKGGQIDEHPLLNKKVQDKTGEILVIDSVCIHFMNGGYYYKGSLRDPYNSHTEEFIGNINSKEEWVLNLIEKFNANYNLLEE